MSGTVTREEYELMDEEWEAMVFELLTRCPICGNRIPYTVNRTGFSGRRRGCSDECCRKVDYRLRTERRRLASAKSTTCIECGQEFAPKRADAKYCSNACRQRAHRSRHLKKLPTPRKRRAAR